jgi:hypothetical protein
VRKRTKIDLDVVDVSFKLCIPSKIMFDMNAHMLDNEMKNCIILRVL